MEENSQNNPEPFDQQTAQIPEPLKFFLAGNAYFTLKSKKTQTRYTYRVSRAKSKEDNKPLELWFVSFLTGPDNWANYTYIGSVRPQPKPNTYTFSTTKASKLPMEAPPCKAISYAFECLSSLSSVPGVEVWHAGKCGRCGRLLTVPESIASGFGPECLGLLWPKNTLRH
jgi:hypothetical protein